MDWKEKKYKVYLVYFSHASSGIHFLVVTAENIDKAIKEAWRYIEKEGCLFYDEQVMTQVVEVSQGGVGVHGQADHCC